MSKDEGTAETLRVEIKHSSTRNENNNSPTYGKTRYYAEVKAPYNKELKGCPLGRSWESSEDALVDLKQRVRMESKVNLEVIE